MMQYHLTIISHYKEIRSQLIRVELLYTRCEKKES